MSTAVLQAIGSFAAGAIAWVALEFLGRPLRKFYDLRGETVYRLAKVANVRSIATTWSGQSSSGEMIGEPELSKAELADLADAIKSIRDLASQFRAFGFNETYALSLVRLIGYDPLKASDGLFGLSNTMQTYNPERAHHRATVQVALKIPNL